MNHTTTTEEVAYLTARMEADAKAFAEAEHALNVARNDLRRSTFEANEASARLAS